MVSLAPTLERAAADDVRAWLDYLRARYDRLAASASSLEDAATVARVGAKLSELRSLAGARAISPRDAAVLPHLASWVAARIDALDTPSPVRRAPLPFPPASN